MSWLDVFFSKNYTTIQVAGVDVPGELKLNFATGVSSTDDPTFNRTNLTVAGGSGVVVKDEGSSLGSFTALNFIGGAVTATNAGGGVAAVTVPALVVKDEGGSLGNFTALNFIGAGVTATDAGGGVAAVTIPGGGSGAVIFDGGATTENVRSDRTMNQSPINNTKDGIVNLSSRSSGVEPGATGDYSTIAGGDRHEASGNYSTVCGGSLNFATGDFATCLGGQGNTASGNFSVASGEGSSTTGLSSFACNQSIADGDYSFACGQITQAQGLASHAEGSNTFVQIPATAGHAEGSYTLVEEPGGSAGGILSQALREGQRSWSSGGLDPPAFGQVGYAQVSDLVMRGTTPGAVLSETVELKFGTANTQTFTLEGDFAYNIQVEAVAAEKNVPANCLYWKQGALAFQSGGAVTVVTGAAESITNGTAGAWTFTLSNDGGTYFKVEFTDTGSTAVVSCAALIRFTQVAPVIFP